MKEEQAAQLQVGDTVYLTTMAYKTILKGKVIFEPATMKTPGHTAIKVIEPFEKSFAHVRTQRLFTSKAAAEVAARMKR